MAISLQRNADVLNQTDCQELYEQAQQQGEHLYQRTELGVRENLPQTIGEGSDCFIYLRDGLTIQVRDGRLRQSIRYMLQHEQSFPLVSKFYLSGSSAVQTPGVSDIANDYEEVAGCNYLYHLPAQIEFEEWRSGESIQVVMVHVDVEYFQSFDLGSSTLPDPLQKLVQRDFTQRFHQALGRTTPAMMQVLQQLLRCPYQGLTQQLYLESKALELLALQFARWQEETPLPKRILLRSDDIERLHHAKKILIQHSTTPPSLMELACRVGLNDRKLKQGFRQLFGTTVFGYLQDYRMQQAKELLHDPDLTIASIAATVGYRNSEAFSTAFRRKFDISPKAYQLRQ